MYNSSHERQMLAILSYPVGTPMPMMPLSANGTDDTSSRDLSAMHSMDYPYSLYSMQQQQQQQTPTAPVQPGHDDGTTATTSPQSHDMNSPPATWMLPSAANATYTTSYATYSPSMHSQTDDGALSSSSAQAAALLDLNMGTYAPHHSRHAHTKSDTPSISSRCIKYLMSSHPYQRPASTSSVSSTRYSYCGTGHYGRGLYDASPPSTAYYDTFDTLLPESHATMAATDGGSTSDKEKSRADADANDNGSPTTTIATMSASSSVSSATNAHSSTSTLAAIDYSTSIGDDDAPNLHTHDANGNAMHMTFMNTSYTTSAAVLPPSSPPPPPSSNVSAFVYSTDNGTSQEMAEAMAPRRQKPRHDKDMYTPRWVRYTGQLKQGYCQSCQPVGKWLQLKNSAYWYHMQFFHGISSVSGQPFAPPLEKRINKESELMEGLCHQCCQFVPICNTKRRNNVLWYRHAHKCHIYEKPKSKTNRQQVG